MVERERSDALPRKGKVVPELSNDAIREVPVYTYRILYEIRKPDIQASLCSRDA